MNTNPALLKTFDDRVVWFLCHLYEQGGDEYIRQNYTADLSYRIPGASTPDEFNRIMWALKSKQWATYSLQSQQSGHPHYVDVLLTESGREEAKKMLNKFPERDIIDRTFPKVILMQEGFITNKEIIWKTIQFIKDENQKFSTPIIFLSIWKDFEAEKKVYFIELMTGLINFNSDELGFQLTEDGKQAHEEEFDEYGNFSKYEKTRPKNLTSYLEYKFLKYIKNKEKSWAKEVNVTEFMISNFEIPDPTSDKTTNEGDNAVNFMKNLKYRKFIDYNEVHLEQVNYWYADPPRNSIKLWFNNLHMPIRVSLTSPVGTISPGNKTEITNKNDGNSPKSLFKSGYDPQPYLNLLKTTKPAVINECGEYILGERKKSFVASFFDVLVDRGVINSLKWVDRAKQINHLIPNLDISARGLQLYNAKAEQMKIQYNELIDSIFTQL